MFLPTHTEKVEKLQAALHTKAEAEPVPLLCSCTTRCIGWMCWGRPTNAAPRRTAEQREWTTRRSTTLQLCGVGKWLEELAEELEDADVRGPGRVRRVWIPKADGKQRPLGIPTIRDRVAQMAAVLILEPIFEADLQPEQHAAPVGR